MTLFFERSGEDAREVLTAFRAALLRTEGCKEVKLLASVQQAGLYLLVSTWAEGSEPPAAPRGTKCWAFQDAQAEAEV